MAIDLVSVIEELSITVAGIIVILAAYRALTIGRAFTRAYRNRAFWIIILGAFTIIQPATGYFPSINNMIIGGLPLFEITFFTLLLSFFVFIDSTIMVALEMDFFHRNTLRWKQVRILAYLAVVGGIVGFVIISSLATLPGAPAWVLAAAAGSGSRIFFIALLGALGFEFVYMPVTLIVAARRTPDRTLRRHLMLLGLLFITYIVSFLNATTFNNYPNSWSGLFGDFLLVLLAYVLYRAVMTLSIVTKITELDTISGKNEKGERTAIVVSAIVIVGLLVLLIYTQSPNSINSGPGYAGQWVATTGYPLGTFSGVVAPSCVISIGYLYCVGGLNSFGKPSSEIYTSTLSTTGVGKWNSESTTYPENVYLSSCVIYGGYLYCVGGSHDDAGDDTASSYFAPLSSSNVGSWTGTTAYPIPVDSQSCVTSSAFIYCVGGTNETLGTNATADLSNSVWYAPLSPSGIGSWTHTTPYPQNLYLPVCVTSGNYIYCLGGIEPSTNIHGGVNYGVLSNTQDMVYYAVLSTSGVGPWIRTTNYPIQVAFQSCGVTAGNIYCVGGEQNGGVTVNGVYYATVSSSGIGAWHRASAYPLGILTTCVFSSNDIYCLGGFEGQSQSIVASDYYVPLNYLSTTNATG